MLYYLTINDIVNLMFREKPLCVIAGFSHVTAKTGKVFGNNHVCFARFKGSRLLFIASGNHSASVINHAGHNTVWCCNESCAGIL